VIRSIHASFLQVGCDVIETDTFGSSRIVLAEYQLEEKTRELNIAAAKLAKEVAAQFSTPRKPRFVAGSIGPTTKLPSMGHIMYDAMAEAYREQIEALIEGGVDVLLVETCQDLLQAKIALAACQDAMRATRKRLPVQVQVTLDAKGRMFLGSKVGAALAVLECFQPDVIGLNCSTGPREMNDTVRFLCENAIRPVSVLPNAGLPQSIDGHAVYALTPAELAFHLKQFVEEYGVRVVGGCCGTTPEHLRAVVEAVEHSRPAETHAAAHSVAASAYSSILLEAAGEPMIVAEEMNATTRNPVFREMVRSGDYGGILALSKRLAKEGSQMLDICCAIVGEDEKAHMTAVLDQIAARLPLPVLIDSTEADVIEEALKRIPGKPLINAVHLEEGEKRASQLLPMARRYGAAVIAMTIDEDGMALTAQKKVAVARRIFELATDKYELRPQDLIFDPLTISISSGREADRSAGMETLEAVRLLKQELPECRTILGISHISSGLSGRSRRVLNSVFLKEAGDRGLDMAMVNFSKIDPLEKISEREVELARKLIFCDTAEGDPLRVYMEYFAHLYS
jgi:5-methyltetrahydrofolate--homocysteine methyltransferase